MRLNCQGDIIVPCDLTSQETNQQTPLHQSLPKKKATVGGGSFVGKVDCFQDLTVLGGPLVAKKSSKNMTVGYPNLN